MKITEIQKPLQHVARVGDVYDLTFKTIGVPFISEIQTNLIKSRVNKNEKFSVVNAESTNGRLKIRVEIVKNPFPLAIAVGAVTSSVVGLFIFLSLSKVEQIINTPEGKQNNLTSLIGIALGAIGIGFLKR